MKTLDNFISAKNSIVKHILKIINEGIDIPLYTVRPENEPLAYVRLMFVNSSDNDIKNLETGIVRLKFNVYSADSSIKEVMEILEKLEGIIKTRSYECGEIAKIRVTDIYVQDVNKPDIRQGEFAVEAQYYK